MRPEELNFISRKCALPSVFRSGPLDFRYTDRWPAMSEWSRWWAAASGAVGPSPALAPAILALAGACLAFATLGRTTARQTT